MENKPRYSLAKKKATEILMLQEDINIPINPLEIKLSDCEIHSISFDEYCKHTNITIEEITLDGKYNDAYTFINAKPRIHLILYNNDIETSGRIKWSIAHEIGHIVLKHMSQGEIEEQEANRFACELLMPQCILKEVLKRTKTITSKVLNEKFGVSFEAGEYAINKLKKNFNKKYEDPMGLDDILVSKFKVFIECNFVYIPSRYDDYEEVDRSNW